MTTPINPSVMLDREQSATMLSSDPTFLGFPAEVQQVVRQDLEQLHAIAEKDFINFVTPVSVGLIVQARKGVMADAALQAAREDERRKLGHGSPMGGNADLERYDEALKRRGVTDDVFAEFIENRARSESVSRDEALRRWRDERARTMSRSEFEKSASFDQGDDARNPYISAGWQHQRFASTTPAQAALTPEAIADAVASGIRKSQRPAETPGT